MIFPHIPIDLPLYCPEILEFFLDLFHIDNDFFFGTRYLIFKIDLLLEQKVNLLLDLRDRYCVWKVSQIPLVTFTVLIYRFYLVQDSLCIFLVVYLHLRNETLLFQYIDLDRLFIRVIYLGHSLKLFKNLIFTWQITDKF